MYFYGGKPRCLLIIMIVSTDAYLLKPDVLNHNDGKH